METPVESWNVFFSFLSDSYSNEGELYQTLMGLRTTSSLFFNIIEVQMNTFWKHLYQLKAAEPDIGLSLEPIFDGNWFAVFKAFCAVGVPISYPITPNFNNLYRLSKNNSGFHASFDEENYISVSHLGSYSFNSRIHRVIILNDDGQFYYYHIRCKRSSARKHKQTKLVAKSLIELHSEIYPNFKIERYQRGAMRRFLNHEGKQFRRCFFCKKDMKSRKCKFYACQNCCLVNYLEWSCDVHQHLRTKPMTENMENMICYLMSSSCNTPCLIKKVHQKPSTKKKGA
eukprot:TRINITY_DN5414_c0_g3_i1.p1 TRINITY_DN5414_c0_g3~~TRINITY_DN5414_c0_g3_i1.p1  ORF type:complete len:285 (+),score=18.63 TRINITY_DN5414_c0_g3_i1:10-864(+)